MPISATVELPLETKDPREAVRECIRLVRNNAINLEAIQVHLALICTSDGGVLIGLAELLPATALGFRCMGSDRAVTAGQFLADRVTGLTIFHGVLTEHFLPADAFALVEKLLQSSARAIRSTAFNLRVENICWRGAPSDATGSLLFSDLKGIRAKRFSLAVSLQIPGENPKSPATEKVLKQVADATGVPFHKGTISQVPGEKSRTLAYGQLLLVGQVCLEETMEDVADKLPKHWVSEFAPNALAHKDAFAQRMQHLGAAANQKVNLPSLLKSVVRQELPEFKFVEAVGERICFAKSIYPEVEAVLLFERELPRLGKAFTLALGVRSLADQMCFEENISRIERTTEQRTWVYSDKAEAALAAMEAVLLVKELLPQFEASLRRYFEPWPQEIPSGIEQLGQLTARQAFVKAEALARGQFADAVLIHLGNHARSLALRDIEGPELSLDGRLIPNAAWSFHFYSATKDASFQVTVPALGRIRFLDHGKQYQDPNVRHMLVPVDIDWMDSDRAFALAEARGGCERRGSGKLFGLMGKMQMSRSQRAYWSFLYLMVDEPGRNDLIVNMDAVTGEPIDDIPGF